MNADTFTEVDQLRAAIAHDIEIWAEDMAIPVEEDELDALVFQFMETLNEQGLV